MKNRGAEKVRARARKVKRVRKVERRLAQAQRAAAAARSDLIESRTSRSSRAEVVHARAEEVLLRVISVLVADRGGGVEIPYARLMAARPFSIEVAKSDPGVARDSSRVTIRLPPDGACCGSSHRAPDGRVSDKACGGFARGANGRCAGCDHHEWCHPGSKDDVRPVGRPL